MSFKRVEITAKTVKEAAAAAAHRRAGTNVWADTKLTYLTIRQRSGAAKWTVRALKTMRTIGDVRERHPEFLSVRDAREKAADVYADLRYGNDQAGPAADEAVVGWTWGDLDREYQAMMAAPRWVNRRMKPPSAGTCDDVRLAFARPSIQDLKPIVLLDLTRPQITEALQKISSHRQREKCCAYFKAALTWAADKRADDSGLTEHVDRWWDHLTAGDPDPEQMRSIEARRARHRERKSALDVKAIGALLARHEAYCSGRTAEDKISPGIRWGLWWVCLTANRRFSTVKLRRDDFMTHDPFAAGGWGRAMWPADTMKAKVPFWLPLPPVVRDVATGSIADYTQLVANEHGDWPSQWVFASTRRHGRDPENDDVSVFPNSLNRHLLRMRAAKALDGLPYFSLHLARSVMTNFLDAKISPVASSLVLAHTLPITEDEAAATTREFYLTSQRMDVKSAAMTA
ncbi:MAG: hypothetical protein J0G33_04070 [Afipia felis]|nr:hypothetical protein [Afipia felis]